MHHNLKVAKETDEQPSSNLQNLQSEAKITKIEPDSQPQPLKPEDASKIKEPKHPKVYKKNLMFGPARNPQQK